MDECSALCPAGAAVQVVGRYAVDARYGAGLTVRALRAAAAEEYDPADLVEDRRSYEQMAADLESLIETVQRPHLRELLRRLSTRAPRAAVAGTRHPH